MENVQGPRKKVLAPLPFQRCSFDNSVNDTRPRNLAHWSRFSRGNNWKRFRLRSQASTSFSGSIRLYCTRTAKDRVITRRLRDHKQLERVIINGERESRVVRSRSERVAFFADRCNLTMRTGSRLLGCKKLCHRCLRRRKRVKLIVQQGFAE